MLSICTSKGSSKGDHVTYAVLQGLLVVQTGGVNLFQGVSPLFAFPPSFILIYR